jgi:hypothetical protein
VKGEHDICLMPDSEPHRCLLSFATVPASLNHEWRGLRHLSKLTRRTNISRGKSEYKKCLVFVHLQLHTSSSSSSSNNSSTSSSRHICSNITCATWGSIPGRISWTIYCWLFPIVLILCFDLYRFNSWIPRWNFGILLSCPLTFMEKGWGVPSRHHSVR